MLEKFPYNRGKTKISCAHCVAVNTQPVQVHCGMHKCSEKKVDLASLNEMERREKKVTKLEKFHSNRLSIDVKICLSDSINAAAARVETRSITDERFASSDNESHRVIQTGLVR